MKIIYKLYFSLLPFRISFFVVDLSMGSNMYLFCTKVYLRNKKIYDTIEKKLTITVLNHFPVELSDGVITEGSINLFVHCSISDRQKLYGSNGNFGTLFYEVILARLVFTCCDKHIVPALLSGIETDECRNLTVCGPICCFVLKKETKLLKLFLFLVLICLKD